MTPTLANLFPPARAIVRAGENLRSLAYLLTTMIGLTLCPAPGHSQAHTNIEDQVEDLRRVNEDSVIGFRRGSFVLAPIPFSSPMIGSGLALGGAYLFKTTPEANTSMIGVGGLRSDNGSQAYGLMFNLALDDNRWLLNSFIGEADIHYDLFLPGTTSKIPIRQDGVLGRISLAYGVSSDLSFGGQVQYLNTSVKPEFANLPPLPPALQPDLGLELLKLGFIANWDTRDNSDYPTSGFHLGFEANQGTVLGGSRDYYTSSVLFDYYRSFGPNSVLAARTALCATANSTPFFEKCSLGSTDSFRGFNMTQFLDTRSVSLQLEFRQRLTDRFGVVAFAGTGFVGPTVDQLTTGGAHSAGGLGLRYRVSKKFPVDFSVDYARNDLGDGLLYIYVGQRF
ncbi:BamA/TamA family outer membrane protein [Phaeobacter marinintestinus]|uniref:BamA/TamA family outer membrane protein n=1 Tax=Falsiphaeobacter marinintestinus TaxID=1492905 RepID=UPI001C94F499|nr:BamA/TamA family outer membrane protein [Phaeobacter marinintestinus]